MASQASHKNEEKLISRAMAGDRAAMEELLRYYSSRLKARLARKIPPTLKRWINEEDIVQETSIEALRDINSFRPQGPDAFYCWLASIAEHRMLDAIKANRAAKRGGRAPTVFGKGDDDGSAMILLEVISQYDRTPSSLAAGHEAVSALQVALAGLQDDYRKALSLRYLERLPVAKIAARMGRDERAIHNLCHRGLLQLREAMGRATQFLTWKH